MDKVDLQKAGAVMEEPKIIEADLIQLKAIVESMEENVLLVITFQNEEGRSDE